MSARTRACLLHPAPPLPPGHPRRGPACLGRRRSRENVSGTRRTVSCSLFFFYNAQGCPRLSAAASGSVLEVKSRKGRFGNGRQGEGRSHSLPAQDRGAVAVCSSFPANRLPEAAPKAVPGTPGPERWPARPLAGLLHARPSLVVSHPAPVWKDVIVLTRAPVATGPRGAQGTDLVPPKRDPRAKPTSGLRFGPRACVLS